MANVQRLVAIRYAAAYRSVSYDAATLVACIPPIDFLVKEKRAHGSRRSAKCCRTARLAFGVKGSDYGEVGSEVRVG